MKVCPLLVCNEGFKSEFTDEGSLEYLSSLFSFLCITWGDKVSESEEFHEEGWDDCEAAGPELRALNSAAVVPGRKRVRISCINTGINVL